MLARYSNTTTIFLSEHLKTKDIPVAVICILGWLGRVLVRMEVFNSFHSIRVVNTEIYLVLK